MGLQYLTNNAVYHSTGVKLLDDNLFHPIKYTYWNMQISYITNNFLIPRFVKFGFMVNILWHTIHNSNPLNVLACSQPSHRSDQRYSK